MRRTARRTILGAGAGALVVGSSGCAAGGPPPAADLAAGEPAPGAAPQLVVFPDDGIGQLLQLIGGATARLDLYVFELDSAEIERRVIEAGRRGVRVRAIVEPNPSGRIRQANQTMSRLRRAGVQVKPAGRPFSKTHAKVLIADGSQAWVGTGNLVDAWRERRDYAVISHQPATVRALARVFDEDWLGTSSAWPIGTARNAIDPRTNVVVGPQNGRSAITSFLSTARSSLRLEHDQLEDPAILDVLGKRSRAGVDVRVVLSEGEGGERTRRGLQLRSPSIKVRLLADPQVHAKLAIADGERVLVGSHNLTKESLDSRRELGLILDDPRVVERALDVFERDFGSDDDEAAVAQNGSPGAVSGGAGGPFLWGFAAGSLLPGAVALAWAARSRRL